MVGDETVLTISAPPGDRRDSQSHAAIVSDMLGPSESRQALHALTQCHGAQPSAIREVLQGHVGHTSLVAMC